MKISENAKTLIMLISIMVNTSKTSIYSAPPNPLLYDNNNGMISFLPNYKPSSIRSPQRFLSFPQYTIAQSAQSTGTIKALVLFVEFQDVKFSSTSTQNYFQDLLFSQTPGSYSLTNYYDEVSYHKLLVTGDVTNRHYVSSHSIEYYGADIIKPGTVFIGYINIDSSFTATYNLIQEVVEEADNDIDFSQYDNDHDGVVDHLIIVHAGGSQEATGNNSDIWSQRWSIGGDKSDGYLTNDGVYVRGYTLQGENSPLGIFCHEFGHDLGLPDIYQAGDWCLMGSGAWLPRPQCTGNKPAHLSDWCKYRLGWITPSEKKTSENNITLTASETHSDAFLKIPISSDYYSEYFLASYRKKSEPGLFFDTELPSEGLLIWKVSYQNINSSPRLALAEADGNSSADYDHGTSLDPFPGSANKTLFTEPLSNTLDNNPSYITLSNIGFDNPELMRMDLTIEDPVHISGYIKDTSGSGKCREIELSSGCVVKKTMFSDNDGFYQFSNLFRNVDFTVRPVALGNYYVYDPIKISTVSIQKSMNEQNFVVERPYVSGCVRDSNGEAVFGVLIYVSTGSAFYSWPSAQTGIDGSYTIKNMFTDIDYTIKPVMKNYTFDPPSINSGPLFLL